VPIYDFAIANEELVNEATDAYYQCCGKSICKGCIHSFYKSGNIWNCPFCKAGGVNIGQTDEETVEKIMKQVEANDVGAIYLLANYYSNGQGGLQEDKEKAMELRKHAAELRSGKAHHYLGSFYNKAEGGDLKKAKFHYEAAAMIGCEASRYHLGCMEFKSGKREQGVKHWMMGASAGDFTSMNALLLAFNHGLVSRESIDSIMISYNNSCTEMRSEARDAFIQNACSQQIISRASDAFVRFSL
jgi:TPR repeat protein